MLFKSAVSAVLLASLSSAAFAAPAATLSNITGFVLVDQGRGFSVVYGPTKLSSGNRIMVSRDGGGTLVYTGPDGCKRKLAPNSITTVGSKLECKPADGTQTTLKPVTAAPVPAAPVAAVKVPVTTATTTATTTAPALAIAGGLGLATAAGIGVALLLNPKDDSNPASH